MHKPIYGVANLRCCKNERKPYWNTTCGFNLVIVAINTSFADVKVTTFAYLSHFTGKLHRNSPETLWSTFLLNNILHSHAA